MLKSLSPKGMIKSEQHVTYKNNKNKHMKVAIQGIKGSFHHIVAEQYFGKNMLFLQFPFNTECKSYFNVYSVCAQTSLKKVTFLREVYFNVFQ